MDFIENCKSYLKVLTMSDISEFSDIHSGKWIVVFLVVIFCRHVGRCYHAAKYKYSST